MTDREKIIETIRTSGYGYFITHDNADVEEVLAQTADALIAAGIGDISKWQLMSKVLHNQIIKNSREEKHRAEVAERALRSLAQLCAKGAKYYLQSNEAVKERERELYDEWIKQAEKELAEEKNNEHEL